MSTTGDRLSTVRFSLRRALAAVTIVALAALALTPLVRRWSAQQAWTALLLAICIAVGYGGGSAVLLALRRRAQRRGGALAGIVRDRRSPVWIMAGFQVSVWLIVAAFDIWIVDSSAGQTPPFVPSTLFPVWASIQMPLIAAMIKCQNGPVELREEGMVAGFHLWSWKSIIRYRWEGPALWLMPYGRPIAGEIAEAERPQVEALLARRVTSRRD